MFLVYCSLMDKTEHWDIRTWFFYKANTGIKSCLGYSYNLLAFNKEMCIYILWRFVIWSSYLIIFGKTF